MSRELMRRALEALEELESAGAGGYSKVIADIRTELEKPEPVECGTIIVKNEYKYWHEVEYFNNMPDGKYRLLAERINES